MAGIQDGSVIDRIYEAAFLPEFWPSVLHDLAGPAGSVGGALFATGSRFVSRWTASPGTLPMWEAYVADPDAPANDRPGHLARKNYPGFLREIDFLPAGQMRHDANQSWLRKHGLGWQMGTMIPMPVGDTVICAFDRPFAEGPHPTELCDRLDAIRPHLARAAMIAARLGLERAKAAVATLEALRLPALVLAASGRVLAANRLAEIAPEIASGAHGSLRLAHLPADRMLREALDRPRPAACSIPMPAWEGRPPAVAHLVPLQGDTCDLMGGSMLVVLASVAMDAGAPDPAILPGLFDLSPREAEIAAALAEGRSLASAAETAGLRVSTARSYLEQILRKTGTKQQSQLVALLKGTALVPET